MHSEKEGMMKTIDELWYSNGLVLRAMHSITERDAFHTASDSGQLLVKFFLQSLYEDEKL